jgi:WD40 repeat protein
MSNLNHACVRILIDDKSPRSPKGAGFLIAPNLVITCAHVVAEVLKIAETTAEKPTQTLFLDFPFVEQQPLQTAIVEAWYPVKNHPRMGDIEDLLALLRLAENVTTQPFTLVDLAVYLNRAVHLTGFPKTKDEGIYLQGYLREITGEGRVQIDTEQGRGSVAGGFSGGAVYDMQENGVVGIVVSIDTYGGDVRGYMIPVATLLKAFPQLDELSRSLNPYKNLFAFTEDDVEFFFGREQATEELYAEVNHKPFITVLGASGSGKSSLVLAGLIPRLKQQHWQVLSLRLKRESFKNLTLTLIPFLEPDKITQAKKLDELSQDLETHKVKLSNLLSLAVKPPCLIFIDQFEELFTNNDNQTQQCFLSCLLEVLNTPSSDIKLLITLRADFMGQSLAFGNLAHVLKQNPPYLLTAMQQNELTAAISKPAAKLGVQFEKGLVAQLLREVGTEAGRLPLLQFTLTKLWEKQARRQISFEAYQQLGGLEKSLVQYADEVWQSFQHDEKQQTRLRYALVQLVRPGLGTEDTRQVALRSDMEQNWDLMQALADKRLVVTGGDETSQTVEIVHEVLIKHWGRMQEWLQQDRAFRIWQNNLRDDIKDWQKNQDIGSLLRGVKLAEAEINLTAYAEVLNANERDFIQESLTVARKEQAEKERQRKRIIKGLLLFLSAITILAIIAGWQWYIAKEQTKIAKSGEIAAKARLQLTIDPEESMRMATQAMDTYKTLGAEDILRKSLFESHVHAKIQIPNHTHTHPIWTVGFSSDSKHVVATNMEDGTVKVLDMETLQSHISRVHGKAFNNGDSVLMIGDDGKAELRNIKTGKLLELPDKLNDVNYAVLSPDSNLIFISGNDNSARILNIVTGIVTVLKENAENVRRAVFSPDNELLVTMDSNWRRARLWNVKTGNLIRDLSGHTSNLGILANVSVIQFSPNGEYIASACGFGIEYPAGCHLYQDKDGLNSDGIDKFDGTVRIWKKNSEKFELFQELNTGDDRVYGLAFDPKSQLIVTASGDKLAHVWSVETGKLIFPYKQHSNWVWSAMFSPDSNFVVTTDSIGGTAQVWDASSGKELLVLRGHKGFVENATFSPDGRFVLTIADDGTARIWELNFGQIGKQTEPIVVNDTPEAIVLEKIRQQSKTWNKAVSSHDRKLVVTFNDRELSHVTPQVWLAETGDLIRSLESPDKDRYKDGILAASFSQDNQYLALAGYGNVVWVWLINTGKDTPLIGHENFIHHIAFSPNAECVATVSNDDGIVRLWQTTTGDSLEVIPTRRAGDISIAFDPSGKYLITQQGNDLVRFNSTGCASIEDIRNLAKDYFKKSDNSID